jgi:hypothetical protein
MKTNHLLFFFVFLFYLTHPRAQHLSHDEIATEQHADESHFRAALLIGHTLITPGNKDTRLFVPSWGLDIEYWKTHELGIGLHTDVELQDFIVLNNEQEEIERKEPIVITVDGLFRLWRGLILMAGPGLEIEEKEFFFLFRAGLEYEVDLGTDWDLFPTLFYDQRLDGYSTLSIGLGVGRHF